MKLKKLFALALAVCMMVSVMPTSFAGNGFLSLDGVQPTTTTSGPTLTLDNGTSGRSTTTSGSVQPRQDGVLYNTSGSGSEGDTTPVVDPVDDPVIIDTTTYSGTNTDNGYTGGGDSGAPTSRKDVDGLFTSKTVTKKNDSTYTVRLEAYTDGTSGTYTSAVPADIVLVLEESQWMSTTMYEYNPTYTFEKDETYYVKNGDSYSAVRWCERENRLGLWRGDNCNGWYTGTHLDFWFLITIRIHWGTEYEPKTSATDENGSHVQFYKREAISTTKMDALADAAEDFVDAVIADANTNDVAHRVSIISYSATANVDVGLVDDIRNNSDEVYSAIMNLTAASGSNLDEGLESAQVAFSNATATADERNKVVVVYSYGVAGTETKEVGEGEDKTAVPTWNDSAVIIANNAISLANTLKTSGISVYTVGMGDDVDPTLDILDENVDESQDIYRTNAFLHFVSSNFPNATSLTSSGTGGSINNGKYLSAMDIVSLNSTFEKIENEFETPSISLDANAEIQDSVSKYFSIDTTTVKVYTANHSNGTFAARENWDDVTDDDNMTVSKSATAVAVKGFNYNSHFVGGSAPQKLIVEFDITVKSGFMGGNNVPTNNATAGVYAGSALIENFTYPLVNVTIPKPVVEVEGEQVIYYGETAPAIADLYTKITPTETDAWKYDFVELTYTVPNGVNNDACGVYDFKLNVKPIASATTDVGTPAVAIDSDVAQVNVHVLEAVLDADDDIIYLGSTSDLNSLVEHSWACDCETGGVNREDSDAAPQNVDYIFSGVASSIEGAYAPAENDCKDLTVTCSHGDDSDTFIVHVLTPTVTIGEQVIYLSQSVEPEEVTAAWENECEHHKTKGGAPSLKAAFQLQGDTSDVYTDSVSPEECKTFVAYPVIDGVVSRAVSCPFKVHVLVPTVKVDDFAMHLSTSVNLEERASTTWACAETGEDNCGPEDATNGRTVPEGYGYNFYDVYDDTTTVETVYSPDSDKTITVIPKVGVKEYTDYSETFAIDVLMPIVTVPKKEVWADMNASVDMDEWYGITASNVGWDAPYNEEMEIVTEAPTGITFDYDFTVTKGVTDGNGHWADEMEHEKYIQGSADSLMTVTKATWTYAKGKSYEAVGDHLIINSEYDFKININKFKAIITNNGTQNAIYTLSNGTKVAVPAKGSVTVAGLICGKDYEISEANNDWTWRYGEAASAKDADGNEKKYISCKVNEVKASDTPESSDRVFMTYGNITNPKWLADEDCVINNAATRDCTIPERKEDGEEVTNE